MRSTEQSSDCFESLPQRRIQFFHIKGDFQEEMKAAMIFSGKPLSLRGITDLSNIFNNRDRC